MSEAALDTLDRVATELRAAMESGETDRITDAVTAFAPALEAVRGIGVWHVNDQFKARIAEKTMLKRMPAVAEVASAAVLMASDHASAVTAAVTNLTCGEIAD